ncbi:hypothetical protein D915_000790 [Fasciola hepatica]|uniref:Beclin 1-associated autophagy-related key regulator n=1 Tax=Fasciola hepatica TaxID=6192 RepID=A0A4E0RJB2_FASHE|nr:hypothetical protein D915_000790 [Fasciola hepatica]
MFRPEEDSFSVSEEFQIVDASCFCPSTSNKPDLEFHPNFPCPVCDSFQGHFLCAQCVNSGSFTSSRRPSNLTYAEISARLSLISLEIRSVNENLASCGLPKTDPTKELEALVRLLQTSIAYHKEQNEKKRERLNQTNQAILRCRCELRQLTKRSAEVLARFSSINKKRLILSKKMTILNGEVESRRVRYLKELLVSLFPVDLAVNKQTPDEFVRAALLIDRVNAFVGPEPIRSSQTALTYCVPVIHAAAKFLGVWLPSVIEKRLCLSGPLLGPLPQRDTLGHIYSSVLHAIHLLCACRLIDVRVSMERLGCGLHPSHSEYNPLLGLYCLGRAEPLREISGPYQLKLDGIFGTVPPPIYEDPTCLTALKRLCLQHDVEQGEEAKELEEGADGDQSPAVDSSLTTSATVLSTVSDLSPAVQPRSLLTVPVPDREPGTVQPDNWEVVTDGVNLPSLNANSAPTLPAGDTWTGSLSKLWWNTFNRRSSNPDIDLSEHD